jgi:hypothetical protein
MTVRFASFNLENLFARPPGFQPDHLGLSQPTLNAYAEFNALMSACLIQD